MNRGLVWSGALHVTVFVVFLLGPGPKPFEWDRADAVPVDLVSVPVEIPDPAPPPPEPEPVVPEPIVEEAPAVEEAPKDTPEDPPPDPKPVQQAEKPKPQPKRVFKKYAPPREDDEPSLAERLKERLDKVSEEKAEAAPDSPPKESVSAASVPPSENTASVEVVNFPYEWYLNVLRTKILAAWDPPGERLLTGHRRDVVVRFRLHRDGSITNVRIDGASGTPGLDASAQRAIDRGGPYPPLPPAYEEQWLDLGVRFMATKE
ncbi:MAG TPA: TonB family protein [bacterium]|nr:TonB family protein [bacterium]